MSAYNLRRAPAVDELPLFKSLDEGAACHASGRRPSPEAPIVAETRRIVSGGSAELAYRTGAAATRPTDGSGADSDALMTLTREARGIGGKPAKSASTPIDQRREGLPASVSDDPDVTRDSRCNSDLPSSDLTEGLRRKDEGIARVEISNADFVLRMREEAVRIARKAGAVHIDDVRRRALELALTPGSSGAWGAIFAQRNRWRKVDRRRSEFDTNHGHESPVWAIVDGTR